MKPTPQATIRLLLFTLALTVSLISTSGAQVWEDSIEMASGDTANYVSQHHPLKRVIVGDPDMVHVDVIAKDEIVLVGRQMGQSKILLRDNMDNTTTLNVFVSPDVSLLKRRIHQLFPNQDVKIYSNANGVILGGTVTGAEIIEQVLRVASQILTAPTGEGPKPIKVGENVTKSASKEELATVIAQKQIISAKVGDSGGSSGTGKSSPQIINLMKIGGPQQVMLEVKFAEVNRNSGRDLQAAFKLGGLSDDFGGAVGVNPFGLGGGGGGAAPSLPSLAGDLFVNLAGLADNANIFLNINKFSLAMQFLEEVKSGHGVVVNHASSSI